jgi:hypothetical protein
MDRKPAGEVLCIPKARVNLGIRSQLWLGHRVAHFTVT